MTSMEDRLSGRASCVSRAEPLKVLSLFHLLPGSPPVEGDPEEENERHEEDAYERVHAAVKKEPLRLSRNMEAARLSIEGPPAKESPMHGYYDNHDKTLVAVPNLMDADGLGKLPLLLGRPGQAMR
jgi:hypothetical protein